MRRIEISHVTEYLFPTHVSLLPHRLLLRPRENHDVRIESSLLEISPAHTLQWKRDVLDNSVALVGFTEPSDRLRVTSSVVIQHYEENPFDFLVDDYAVIHPFEYAEEDRAELAPFQQSVYPSDRDAVQRWLDGLGLQQPMETFVLLDRMNREIASRFIYQMREEPGVQPPALTLESKSGSCRDFAALFMEACRFLGLASRFVSGYLFAPATAAGNASTHAWAEAYLPGAGWKGFDPTSGEVVGNKHIAVAVARHPEAVPPVAGSYLALPDQHPSLSVAVRVSALPAVRLPPPGALPEGGSALQGHPRFNALVTRNAPATTGAPPVGAAAVTSRAYGKVLGGEDTVEHGDNGKTASGGYATHLNEDAR